MPAHLENSAVATGLEKVSSHSNSKERQYQRMFKTHTIALISHSSKVMLKILQVRVQQYVKYELPDVQPGLRKGRGPKDQVTISAGSSKKQEIPEKNIYFYFIDYAKAFDCVNYKKLWKILQEIRIPDHLTYLMRNLYAG